MILKQGQIIGNRWNVVYQIKENPYAESYRVEDESGNPYFLKIYRLKNMPEKLIQDGKIKEIEWGRVLNHKNIISTIETGTYSDEAGECQYLVANYFSGELLSELLLRETRLEPAVATKIFIEMLEGLMYMHHMVPVVLHNDINPTNIMLSSKTGGVAEIIDLGHLSSRFVGTPPFDTADLDPRYASGQSIIGKYDERNDIFAATGVLYTMLTGRYPWDVKFSPGMTRKEKIRLVKSVRDAQGEIPLDDIDDPKLASIIKQGLALAYDQRYASIEDMLRDVVEGDDSDLAQQVRAKLGEYQADDDDEPDDDASDMWGGLDNDTPGDRPSQQQQVKSETSADIEVKRGGGNGFADIAGMDDLKQMLHQRVILILKDKDLAKQYRLSPPNGLLLYGPPGCGKSFFAEKFAEETGFNFMLVKASDLGSIYIHGSQGKIADLFKKAEENAPTVLCFDEFDAFVPSRSGDLGANQAGEVNEFLSQLNNCSQRGIFVIATSNRPDKVDPAVLRTGRIDKLVYVPMPDQTARRLLFELYLKDRPCDTIDCNVLADKSAGYVASDIAYVVNEAATIAAFNRDNITQELLIRTIEGIKPSVDADLLKEYEQMRTKIEGISRTNALPRVGFV